MQPNQSVISNPQSKKIWIDLDNTPHVPFFLPIIKALESRGHTILLTTRRITQLVELAGQQSLKHTTIGTHAGKSKFRKIQSLFSRAFDCYRFLGKPLPDLALSHGARSQILASNFLRIPTVEFIDYEHVATPPFCKPKWEIAPSCYPESVSRVPSNRFKQYPGIKEDVYAAGFNPTGMALEELGISSEKIIITLRPPATEAHYHNPEADEIFHTLLATIQSDPKLHAIILPRNEAQREEIAIHLRTIADRSSLIAHPRTEGGEQRSEDKDQQFSMPRKALNALNLIWESDLVIGGGGTMTREGAALSIPSYSFFRGALGAVDAQLVKENRLTLIESPSDIESKIDFKKKTQRELPSSKTNSLDTIVSHVEAILETEVRRLSTED